ncbi:phage portal protein family protein, partial [Escherichia coli]|uniref:phage portal protein family protein n=1 Tax=Escherichia coli TaxID=562 RepID=UPI001C58C461
TFRRMECDGQIRACLTTKRLSVLSETAEVRPGDDSAAAKRAADVVRAQLEAIPGGIAGIASGCLDALSMGYAVGELVFAEAGTLAAVRWHDP